MLIHVNVIRLFLSSRSNPNINSISARDGTQTNADDVRWLASPCFACLGGLVTLPYLACARQAINALSRPHPICDQACLR